VVPRFFARVSATSFSQGNPGIAHALISKLVILALVIFFVIVGILTHRARAYFQYLQSDLAEKAREPLVRDFCVFGLLDSQLFYHFYLQKER